MAAATETKEEKSKVVHVPGKGPVNFPASLSDEQIVNIIEDIVSGQIESASKPGPTMGETVQLNLENILPAAGATAGAVAGVASPIPGGAVIGGALGGAGGAALAGATRPLLMPDADPETLLQRFQNMVGSGALAGASEAALPVVGRVVGPAVRAGGRMVQRALIGTPGQEIAAARTALKGAGSELSLGQMAGEQATVASVVESIAENSLFGARPFAKFRQSQEMGIKQLADDLAAGAGTRLNDSQVGNLLVDSVQTNLTAFKASARMLYRQVDQLAQGATVNTSSVFRFLKDNEKRMDVRKLQAAAFPEGADEMLLTTLPGVPSTPGRTIPGRPASPIFGPTGQPATPAAPARQIPGTPGIRSTQHSIVTFERAQEVRARLLEIGRRRPASVEDVPVVNLAKKLAATLDTAIDISSQGLSPTARTAFRDANEFYKKGQEQFQSRMVRALVKTLEDKPGQLSRVLLKPDNVDTLKKVRAAMGSVGYEQVIQPKLATSLLHRAKDSNTGAVSGKALLAQIKSLGQETIDTAMTPGTTNALRDLANAVEVASSRSSGPGRVFVQLAQFGAMVELVAAPIATLTGRGEETRGTAAVILLGPWAASRMMTSPAFIRMVADGVKAGPKSQTFTRLVAQLAVAAQVAKDKAESDTKGETPTADVRIPAAETR